MIGSRYDDVLRGSGGPDLLAGDTGDDFLYGLGGGDTLFGGAHDDLLIGGPGPDTSHGSLGFDRCAAERRSGCERVIAAPALASPERTSTSSRRTQSKCSPPSRSVGPLRLGTALDPNPGAAEINPDDLERALPLRLVREDRGALPLGSLP